MPSASFIKVELSQTEKAFRINGVTFAKRRLAELFPAWEATEQSFCRLLVLTPFIAETRSVEKAPTECGKYTVAKCKRILAALNLPEEHGAIVAAFMVAVGQMGDIEPENFSSLMDQAHDHLCDCGEKREPKLKLKLREGQTVH